ncbi:Pentatricopeptide repeat-containing protein [Cardamine amara subsp. amara]|uniref:Pentatricopeptide repeat-containing protein n=1 Tax=Cardamine amara subsp. amara TaxID=228776 RepID=A0ABD1BNV8_CARAN
MFLRSIIQFYSKPSWMHRSYSSSGNTEFNIYGEVINILAKKKPIEPALEPLVPFLSNKIITSVIKDHQINNRRLGFRFFIWASRRERLRSRDSFSLIIDMLSEGNGCDLYWQTLEELKSGGVSVNSYCFCVLISAYAKMDMAEKAVESFGKMKEFDCRPDVFTYNVILRVMMRKEMFFMLAFAVYNEMLKCNCSPNRYTFGILMDGLYKKGRMSDAQKMFDDMTGRGILPNRVTYTILISGLCQRGSVDDARKLFYEMKASGNSPDSVAHNALLDGFCKLGRMTEAFELLRLFEIDGFVLGLRGYSSLIDGLFRARRYAEAFELYAVMLKKNIKPDVVLYTILIQGLSKAGKIDDALKLLSSMASKGIRPDTYCYNAIIKALCERGLLEEARSLQLEMSETESFPDAYTHTILICSMCRNGLVKKAEEIFKEIEKRGCSPSVATFNALIDGLCKSGELKEARLLLHKMEVGRPASLFLRLSHSGNRSFDTMVESGSILKAFKDLAHLADTGNSPDMFTYNVLLNGFCKEGNIDGALKLFSVLQLKGLSPDSVTYNTLINGLYRVGREEEAFKLFYAKDDFRHSPAVYRSLMTWSCRKRKILVAFSLWMKYLKKISCLDDEAADEIEQCFKEGDTERALRRVMELDTRKDELSLGPYTIWLIGLCQSGRFHEALMVFSVLREKKILVTPPSCVKLIHGLCKREQLDAAIDVFSYTLDNNFKLMPRVCNYLLSSLLQSRDKMEIVSQLIKRMELSGYDIDRMLRLKHLKWNIYTPKTVITSI